MLLRTSELAAVSALALLAGLAACSGGSDDAAKVAAAEDNGFADQSVSEIQDQVASAMTQLTSIRINGALPLSGEILGVDLALNTEGDCVGSFTISGGMADLIVGGGSQYLKGDDALWEAFMDSPESAKQMTKALGDKWAMLPADGQGFTSFCNLDGMLAEFDSIGSIDSDDSSVKIGEVTGINGTPALELISEDDTPTSIWVATEAPHYIVQITMEGDASRTINFSDFDVEVAAEAPPEDEVVDLSKL